MRSSVSVIIPTLGRQTELHQAIRSIMPQIVDGDEVLIVDDGSSPPIELDDELDRLKQIRIVRQETSKGPAAARNLGISSAKNDVVAFLDSDDVWLEGKLGPQIEAIERGKDDLVAVVCGWNEHVGGRPFRNRIPKAARSRSDHFMGCWFCPGSTLVVHKAAFAACGPYSEDIRRLEDYEWFLRFALKGGRLEVVHDYGAIINRGANNKPALVEDAAAYIRRFYDGRADIAAGERRGMMAYLHLELAGSYRNEKKYLRAVSHIFTSLLYRPRLSLQLRKWWTIA